MEDYGDKEIEDDSGAVFPSIVVKCHLSIWTHPGELKDLHSNHDAKYMKYEMKLKNPWIQMGFNSSFKHTWGQCGDVVLRLDEQYGRLGCWLEIEWEIFITTTFQVWNSALVGFFFFGFILTIA